MGGTLAARPPHSQEKTGEARVAGVAAVGDRRKIICRRSPANIKSATLTERRDIASPCATRAIPHRIKNTAERSSLWSAPVPGAAGSVPLPRTSFAGGACLDDVSCFGGTPKPTPADILKSSDQTAGEGNPRETGNCFPEGGHSCPPCRVRQECRTSKELLAHPYSLQVRMSDPRACSPDGRRSLAGPAWNDVSAERRNQPPGTGVLPGGLPFAARPCLACPEIPLEIPPFFAPGQ